jgi:hypothetical protein
MRAEGPGVTTVTHITVRVPLKIRHRPGRQTMVMPAPDGAGDRIEQERVHPAYTILPLKTLLHPEEIDFHFRGLDRALAIRVICGLKAVYLLAMANHGTVGMRDGRAPLT